MQSRSHSAMWKIFLSAALVAAFSMACGEEDTPVILDSNECGGDATLEYDGDEAEPGDSCGDCGELVCDGDNELSCEDPGLNECDGCAELDHTPGGTCSDDGDSGVYACDGGDEVICTTEGVNSCGGLETLPDEPDESCGTCGLGSYRCAGPNDVECNDTVGCPQPSDISATQGEHPDSVVLTWRGSIYASGYQIYRDGEQLTTLSPGRLSYTDESADPAGAPDTIDLTASTDRSDGVQLEWEATGGEAAEHEYSVEILYPNASSETSAPVIGYRGVAVDHYEVSIDDGSWMNVGDATDYLDTDAPMAMVDEIDFDVIDRGWDFLELEADVMIDDAQAQQYVVRATTPDGEQSESNAAAGYRHYDDPHYSWYVSDEDSVDESDFDALYDCDDAMTCLDDDFPVDSDVAEKFYRLAVDGDGLEWTESSNFGAEVEMLHVVPHAVEEPVMAGESTEFSIQIESADGDPVERAGVELETEIDDGLAISDPMQDVVTDANGVATVSYTFAMSADDVTIEWQATDDPRVDDATVVQGPFDVH